MKRGWNRSLSRNFRRVLLCIALGMSSSLLSLSAIGQAQRARQVSQTPNRADPQVKPTPKPATPQNPPKKPEQPPSDQSEVLRINSNLVAVPVSVTDTAGQPVRNLTKDDFRVEEEGKVQQVETVGEPGKTPVEMALLFDVSGSVHERFQFERQAASRFLKEVLKPNDAVTVFSIGLAPKLVQARTPNVDQAIGGVMAIEATKEATAFFDTVVQAAHYLNENASPGTRRVLVVISDGEDNNSDRYKLGDALRELQRADCLFYSINPSGPSIRLNKMSLKGQEGMTALANETGGAAFLPDKFEELEAVFRQIASELQAQYLLGYYSTDERANGAFRRIAVHVPKRPNLRVRARQGYYAPKA